MSDNNLQEYFRSQQVSLQWLPFLRAFATELSASADIEDLQHLFFNLGTRFAKSSENHFEDVQTLQQLEIRLNEYWGRLNWGWTEFNELKGFIEITHHASPLAEAFGDHALPWSTSLLEGFYQAVFSVLGASEKMVVRRLGEPTDGMDVKLRFGRA